MQRTFVWILAAVVIAGLVFVIWRLAKGSQEAADHEAASEAERLESGAPRTEPSATRPISSTRFDPGADPDETAAASSPSLAENGAFVIGKVVDDRRRPQANATIELTIPGNDLVRGKSGSNGQFRIGIGPRAAGMLTGILHATGPGGGVAVKDVYSESGGGDLVDVGTIPLLAGSPLTIRVLKDGVPAPGARVFIGNRNALGLGALTTGADGSVAARRLPEGSFLVAAYLGDGFRAEAQVAIPRPGDAPLDVDLAPAWRLLVTVKDGATGLPVAGLPLRASSTIQSGDRSMFGFEARPSKPIQPTDAEGHSVLAGLSPERSVSVSVVLPNSNKDHFSGAFDDAPRATAKPGQEELVITLDVGETFTFPIVADETPGPPDGAVVKLSVPEGYGGANPPQTGKVVGRDLVIDRVPERCVNILAVADDGSMAIVRILGDARKTKVGSEAKFKNPRALLVTAHERGGAPLAGYIVNVVTPGNVGFANRAVVDAAGNARIDGVYPQRADVRIRGPKSDRYGGKVAGNVDLTQPGDGRIDITLEPEREYVAHVTVDGEPRLPGSYTLRLSAGDRPAMRPPVDMGAIEEDPEKALLRFKLRLDPDGENLQVNASGKGYAPLTADLPRPQGSGPTDLNLDFVSGATIKVHVLPPADNVHNVSIQRYAEATAGWVPAGAGMRPDGPEMGKSPTELSFDSLRPGRYRARDALTGLVSKHADVSGGSTIEFTLDLARSGPITGRVEGPADESGEVMVIAEGGDLFKPGADYWDGIRVSLNKEFKVRVPGDRPVTLRAKHALLVPSPDAPSAVVTAPGSNVVLKLVRGPEATFRIPNAPAGQPRGVPGGGGNVIKLFAGNPEGEPAHKCEVRMDEGVGRIGGYKPGKYTLFCDLAPGAPLVLKDVELGSGKTDLGDLAIQEGATIRVKVVSKSGQGTSRLYISATALDGVPYTRTGYGSAGATEGTLRGLGPGRFKVEVGLGGPFSTPNRFEVTSTGSGEIPLTAELK